MLNIRQQEILKQAASGLNGQDFALLPKIKAQEYIDRVEQAIRDIHKMDPTKFIYSYKNDQKVDIQSLAVQRNFYHEPKGHAPFNSVVRRDYNFQTIAEQLRSK